MPASAARMPHRAACTPAQWRTRCIAPLAATVSTALGINMPALAAAAPATPATFSPTKAELIITGPGLSWVSARPSMNSRAPSQW